MGMRSFAGDLLGVHLPALVVAFYCVRFGVRAAASRPQSS